MEDLVHAARINDLDQLRLLLAQGAGGLMYVDTEDDETTEMEAACSEAARYNHTAALNLLLDHVDHPASYCRYTIEEAIDGSHKDIIDCMIARGWDPSSDILHGTDALKIAIGRDNLEMVEFLLSRGADPNANSEINSSLARATRRSKPMFDALMKGGARLNGSGALSSAARQGRTDMIIYMLDLGADINDIKDNPWMVNYPMMNALYEAAHAGQPESLRLLLERGADPCIKDQDGRSALEIAKINDHESCVEILNQHLASLSEN